MEVDKIKRIILEDLVTPPRWGGKHTDIRNLKKSLPSNLTSTKKGKKLIDRAIKELINDNLLLCKKSVNELHVSLNPRKKLEIMNLILNK